MQQTSGVSREARVDFRASKPPARRGLAWVACACIFVTVCLSSVVFFLASSDLTLESSGGTDGGTGGTGGGTGSGTGTGKRLGPECETDADCVSCCEDVPGVFLNPCLLPPNASAPRYVCVDRCCVPPAPPPAPAGTPCSDGLLCTSDDRCDGQGVCAGAPLSCEDADFCTAETCSETLGGVCVSAPSDAGDVCENFCPNGDADCRTGYFCLPSKICGKMPDDTHGSLLFLSYELEPCVETADAWSMTQHYALYESVSVDAGGARRYRVIQSESDVVLNADGYDVHALTFSEQAQGVPLVSVQALSQTKAVELGGAPLLRDHAERKNRVPDHARRQSYLSLRVGGPPVRLSRTIPRLSGGGERWHRHRGRLRALAHRTPCT